MYNLFNRVFTFKRKAKSKTVFKNVIPSTNISIDNINDPITIDEPLNIVPMDIDNNEYLYEYGFFIDNSKSTEKNKEYHTLLANVIKQKEYVNSKFYYWNSICYESDYNTIYNNSTKTMYGTGGTNIESIYKFIKAKKLSFTNIVIFTDATSTENTVQNILFDVKIINYKKYWNNVIGYMLNNKSDISAFIPFIYGCSYKLYNCYNKIIDEFNYSNTEIINIIRQLNCEKHIDTYIDIIEKRILTNTSIASDQYLKLELILMNTRIVSNLNNEIDFEITNDPLVIIKAARTFYQTNINSINIKFNYLIELCDDIRGFILPKVNNCRIFKNINKVEYTEYKDNNNILINKPIILFSKSIDSIINENDPAFYDIAYNPLKILGYPRIIQNFKKQYIQFIYNSTDIDTNDYNIFSFELDSSSSMNMEFISKIFYNDTKFPGAYGLWITAIYYMIYDMIPYDTNDYINQNMKSFLNNTPEHYKIPMGITNHGDRPNYKTNINIALYYSILSTFLYSKKYVERDLMKDLAWIYVPICSILKLSDIDVSEYKQRIEILKTAYKIIKSLNTLSHKKLLSIILSRVAKSLTYNDDIYILDNIISEADYQTCIEYTVIKHIKDNIEFKNFAIDFNIKLINPIIDLNIGNIYSEYENSKQSKAISISCRSLRPLSIINNKSWIHYAEATWGPMNKQLSMYRYMLDYFIIYKTFPNPNSLSDMIKYINLISLDKNILPDNIDSSYKDIAQQFYDSFNRRKILFPDLCAYDKVLSDIKSGISIHKRQLLESRDNIL